MEDVTIEDLWKSIRGSAISTNSGVSPPRNEVILDIYNIDKL